VRTKCNSTLNTALVMAMTPAPVGVGLGDPPALKKTVSHQFYGFVLWNETTSPSTRFHSLAATLNYCMWL
jgi:hypothetical protein